MSKINALKQKELVKVLKDRMEEFRDGVISKVREDRLDFEAALQRNGVLLEEDINLINNGLLDFDTGAKIRKYKGQDDKWVLTNKGSTYPCLRDGEYIKFYYKDDITKLKKMDEEEIKIILTMNVLREDDAVLFRDRKGSLLDLDPTDEAISKWNDRDKAQRKVDKRAKNYRDRVDRWWDVAKKEAKKREGGIL